METKITTILCYGDSNTWGAVPGSDKRHGRGVRWTGVLQGLLGKDFEVINEGLCGRTFIATRPEKPHLTGITHLTAILKTAAPIDQIIVMLGTNDVKSTFNLSAEDIAKHLETTIELIEREKQVFTGIPKILIVCPPSVIVPKDHDLDERLVRGIELFKTLPAVYKKVAEKHGCGFLNAGDFISSSDVDGYHLDAVAHKKLAEAIYPHVQ